MNETSALGVGPRAAGTTYRLALGRALAALRYERGWSLSELSERTGLSVPYLSELERGRKAPSPEVLERLAVAFSQSLASFLRLIAGQLDLVAAHEGAAASLGDLLAGLSPDERAELETFAEYLRWRRSRAHPADGTVGSTLSS